MEKNIQVTINPTEIKSLNFTNKFSATPGTRIELRVKNEVGIRLNPTNPVAAVVIAKVTVVDEGSDSISMQMETITSVVVSTFVDNLDQYIKDNYLNVIMMAANEKIRAVSALMGIPIRIPNPKFGATEPMEQSSNTLYQ